MPYAAAIGAALTGLSALSGLFGKKKQTSDTTSNSTSTPVYDPSALSFRDFLMSNFKDNISNNAPFEDAYRSGGIQNIQQSASRSGQSLDNILTSRGINRTTAGASAIGDHSYRSGMDISSFLSSLPLLFDKRRNENLNSGAAFLSSLPTGSSTVGSSHTEGTGPAVSPLGGGITGGASGLAAYLGQISANQQLGDILKKLGSSGQNNIPMPG